MSAKKRRREEARMREAEKKDAIQKGAAKFFNQLVSRAPKGPRIDPPDQEKLEPYEGEKL